MSKTKAIFYFHGFNSGPSPHNDKALQMREYAELNGYDFHYPAIDYRDLSFIRENWRSVVKYDNVVLVGTSMGAWVAAIIAQSTGDDVIAINPRFDPHISTQFWVDKTIKNYVTGEEYIWTKEHVKNLANWSNSMRLAGHRTLILGDSGDGIVPEQEVRDFCVGENYCRNIFYFPGGSHRFDHMTESMPMIRQFINGKKIKKVLDS